MKKQYSKIKMTRAMLVLVVTFFLSGCGPKYIAEDFEKPYQRTTYSFDQGMYPSDQDLFLQYRITPGDVLDVMFQITAQQQESFEIDLYHEIEVVFPDLPQLTSTQKIMPTGDIILPYIGQVKVLGLTLEQTTKLLEEKYKYILLDPQLSVKVTNMDVRIEQIRRDLMTAPRGLSKLVNVRPDGYATFPLIGDYFVAHKTIDQVNKLIQEKYNDYLPGMQADLYLHEQAGSVIYMMGEVSKPGTYEIKKPINLIQAVTLAGSFTENAKLETVILFRKHEQKLIARRINLENLLELKDSEAFFFLKPDDIVYVPKTQISSLAVLMRQIADIALFNGWSISGGKFQWVDDLNN
ncbi:MAG: polysaccharide biosynthesis/export family protein [Proteobacteria bacterium]|nr:polysaccharide biosynthesis/export family protein [Pseudomonadota bacterium]